MKNESNKNYKLRYTIFMVLFIVFFILSIILAIMPILSKANETLSSTFSYSDEGRVMWGEVYIWIPDDMIITYDMLDSEKPQIFNKSGYEGCEWFDSINPHSKSKLKQFMKDHDYAINPGNYFVEVNSTFDELRTTFSFMKTERIRVSIEEELFR